MAVSKEHNATTAVITCSIIVLQGKENIASPQKGAQKEIIQQCMKLVD